ncbi:SRPBCC domain-containing protein [Nocardioides panacisoli]|uniref:SRPBCC family protein n=1 Tax=Nocardioides panacisoli TaxID=627624 RepID=UPI001C62A105|nr:SRPBCC family protein [Nocardioides panacisoli]QYJ03386.1 SRPBCC domain-containing protein [Nocardioides panacisoli]
MPVTEVHKDADNLTMTVVADFAAPLQRVWDAYVDPRQLEKFWGPPGFPATFTRHDCFPGGLSHYTMTGQADPTSTDLEQEVLTHGGYWEWLDVKAPEGAEPTTASFEVRDGFSREDGTPNTDLPGMRMVFGFEATPEGTRMSTTTYFAAVEEMAQILEMGAEEGMREAMAQIDDVLTDLSSFAAGRGTTTTLLDDTRARISRVIRGSVDQVWRAHHDPELVRQWMLGPDGWRMVTCEVATEPGETYRYEWEPDGEGEGFGFTGTLTDSEPPYRSAHTEQMIGDPTMVAYETTFTPVTEGTLLSHVMSCPSQEVRDQILATGMTDGMETSYQRLERVIAA